MEASVLFLASSTACLRPCSSATGILLWMIHQDDTYTTFLERTCFSLRNKKYLYRSFLVLVFFKGCMSHPYIKVFFYFHAFLLHVFACLILNIDNIWMCWNLVLFLFLIPSDPSFKRISCCSAVFSTEDSFQHIACGQAHFICMLSYPRKKPHYEKGKGRSCCFSSFINIQQRCPL